MRNLPKTSSAIGPNAMGESEPKLSEADKRQRNQYLREFVPAMIGYAVVLGGVLSFVDVTSENAKYWMLLPILPMMGVALAVYRSLQRADEYTRLIQLEGMSVGFVAAIFASLTMGFLGIAEVSTTYAGWLVFGVAMGAWGLTVGLRGVRD